MIPRAALTVDLDSIRCYAAIHDLPLGAAAERSDPIFTVALPRMLELFEDCGLRATLFCVGQDLEDAAAVAGLRRAVGAGHELGNHSLSHYYDLRSRGEATIAAEIDEAASRLAAVAGRPVVGFRAPGYNLSPAIAQHLVRAGYRYDSSLFPCLPYWAAKAAVMGAMRLRGLRSRSQRTLAATLTAPLRPYRADPARPWRRAPAGEAGLWEVPMALVPALRFPLIGTSLHLLGAGGFRRLVPLLRRAHPALLQLEFHAIDFMDRGDAGVPAALAARQPDLDIPLHRKLATWRGIFAAVADAWRFDTLEDAVAALDAEAGEGEGRPLGAPA